MTACSELVRASNLLAACRSNCVTTWRCDSVKKCDRMGTGVDVGMISRQRTGLSDSLCQSVR